MSFGLRCVTSAILAMVVVYAWNRVAGPGPALANFWLVLFLAVGLCLAVIALVTLVDRWIARNSK